MNKYVALTFDDGPHPLYTEEKLAILQAEDVPATFFFIGENILKYPEVVQKVQQAGQQIANHTFSHPDLTTLSKEEVRAEVRRGDDALFQTTGCVSNYLRPPYGNFNRENWEAIGKNLVTWSIDTQDWQEGRTTEEIFAAATQQVTFPAIILMHCFKKETVVALPKIIHALKEAGGTFVTVAELLSLESAAITGIKVTN